MANGKQIVVRTFPQGYLKTIDRLEVKLSEGYKVIMVTVLKSEDGTEVCDYILQKDT